MFPLPRNIREFSRNTTEFLRVRCIAIRKILLSLRRILSRPWSHFSPFNVFLRDLCFFSVMLGDLKSCFFLQIPLCSSVYFVASVLKGFAVDFQFRQFWQSAMKFWLWLGCVVPFAVKFHYLWRAFDVSVDMTFAPAYSLSSDGCGVTLIPKLIY